MAWTVADHGSATNTSGATLAKASLANITVGSLIVVAVTDRSIAASGGSCTDAAGNTYTPVTPTALNGSSSNGFTQFFYTIVTTQLNSGANVTYTKQTSGARCAIAVGSATNTAAIALDTAITAAATGTGTSLSGTSGTPSGAGALLWAWGGSAGGKTATSDAGHSWTSPPLAAAASGTAGSDAVGVGAEQVNAGTGTTIYAPTTANSGAWAVIIIGFSNGGNVYNVSITEAASAAEVESSVATLPASITESGAATESESSLAVLTAARVEAAAATEVVSSAATLPASITEAGSASDNENGLLIISASISEAASASETESVSLQYFCAIAEVATAAESENATLTLAVAIAEAASAADAISSGVSPSGDGAPRIVRDPFDRTAQGRFIPGAGFRRSV